jgi:hypothetical protein
MYLLFFYAFRQTIHLDLIHTGQDRMSGEQIFKRLLVCYLVGAATMTWFMFSSAPTPHGLSPGWPVLVFWLMPYGLIQGLLEALSQEKAVKAPPAEYFQLLFAFFGPAALTGVVLFRRELMSA